MGKCERKYFVQSRYGYWAVEKYTKLPKKITKTLITGIKSKKLADEILDVIVQEACP